MNKYINTKQNFTFVNILIALIVLSVCSLSLLYAIQTANDARDLSNKSVIAYLMAESEMEKTIAGIKSLDLPNNYTSSETHNIYTVSVKSEEYNEKLYKITVQVNFELHKFGGQTKPYEYKIESLVALP